MEHVVFFPAHDGSPAFRRTASLEDAVRLVEHLRNAEGVDHVSVHALTEVPLAFKAYYRVEMSAQDASAAPEATELVVEPVVEQVPQREAEVPVLVPEQEQPVAAAEPVSPAAATLGFFSRTS